MIESGPLNVKLDPSRYVVEEMIARGGMGTIYRVLDRSLGRTVAMKVCSRSPGSDREASAESSTSGARFIDEAQVTARLNHPGIVPVHELGASADDLAYFTMPLVDGSSLGDVYALARAGQQGWLLSRVVAALIKVCQAVAHAHANGIVHRDLKPANVMVGSLGQVYVLDWGLAKTLDQAPVQSAIRLRIASEDGLVVGTPAYMPPEQAAGASEAIDARCDVYALGAMIYELLTGQPPYVPSGSRVDPQAVLARIHEGPPKPILALDPRAPRELVAICERAMARNRAERYASAFELAEDLQAYLDHRVVSAYRTGALAEFRAWSFRHRALITAVAAVAVISLAAFFAVSWYLRQGEARRLIESAQAEIARHNALRIEIPRMQKSWLDARMTQEESAESWQRREEIEKHWSLERARNDLGASFSSAELQLSSALQLAPSRSTRRLAEQGLQGLYSSRRQAILEGEPIELSPEHYESQIKALEPAELPAVLDPPGRIELASEPGGAEVYCFRYVEGEDTRLEPRPFYADRHQTFGEPFLRVEAILNAEKHQGIFAAGDRLLTVRGRTVSTRRELALALEGLKSDERVAVELVRLASRLQLEWVPFPGGPASTYPAGALVKIPLQLGLTFEGYPLDFTARGRLGVTQSGQPLEIVLPRGSYLLVLRKSGFHDARFPVVVPWREGVELVHLAELSQLPAGFVSIPAGPFISGGDRFAFQSLDRQEAFLPDYAIARLEVTVAEYREFLSAPEVFARTDENGMAAPQARDVQEELALAGSDRLLLVPASASGELFLERRNDNSWAVKAEEERLGRLRPRSPIRSVSQLAAREYAHWRSTRDPHWIYRLPDDLEWEKAARGVDRRTHVWGEYLIWSFAWSAKFVREPRVPSTVGMISTDESVYGVRDLAGSVDEHTSSRISPTSATRRGGNWSVSDSQNLRIATRNGRLSSGRGTETGFRLVAERRR